MEDEGSGSVVDFSRGGAVMGATQPAFAVEAEERVELGVGVDQREVVREVDFVVFDGAPEPFDEDVADGPASAIHRDGGWLVRGAKVRPDLTDTLRHRYGLLK